MIVNWIRIWCGGFGIGLGKVLSLMSPLQASCALQGLFSHRSLGAGALEALAALENTGSSGKHTLGDILAYPGIDQECSGMAHGHSSRNYSSGPPYRLCAWDPSIPLLGRIPQDTRSVWETRSVWDIAQIQSKSRECMGCPRASQGVSKIIKSFTDIR